MVFKKLFVLMFCMIFLVGTVSAFEWDNVKKFDKSVSKYGKIEIKNSFLRIPFLNFGKVSEYTLKENTDQCFVNCYAIGEATLYSDGILFNNFQFKTRNGENRNIHYKLFIKVNNEWSEYNGEVLQLGTYEWKIIATKNFDESIDWIGSAFGVDFTEWAWWNTDWTKKQQLNISEKTGNSWNNYSVYINVSFNANMNGAEDLRFLNSSETGELNYFVEKNDSSNIYVWVRTPLTASINNTIYMYYGNPSATSNSNPNMTFLWYDDGLTDRTSEYSTSGDNTVSWGSNKYTFGGGASGDTVYYPTGINVSNVSIEVNKSSLGSGGGAGTRFNTNANQYRGQTHGTNQNLYLYKVVGGAPSVLTTTAAGVLGGNYYYISLWNFGSTLNVTTNGYSSQTTDTSLSGGYAGISSDYTDTGAFNFLRIRQYGNPEPTTTFGIEESFNSVRTDLISPINNSIFSIKTITFIANSTPSNVNLTNVTLFIYNSSDQVYLTNFTSLSGNITVQTNWTMNISIDGTYKWNVLTRGDGSLNDFDVNRTLIIDTTAPVLNISAPNETITYFLLGNNLSLNWSVSDTNLQSCWFEYAGINTTVTCAANNYSFITTSQNNLIFYANDTGGNLARNITSWDYKILQTASYYNPSTTEGSVESFLLNYTQGGGVQTSIVKFIYNNTAKTSSFSVSSNNVTISESKTIDNIVAQTNLTFYWSITMSDSSVINTSYTNQTVSTISIDDCSGNNATIYNFTIKNEEDKSTLGASATNTSGKVTISIKSYDSTQTILNFSSNYSYKNPFAFCMSTNLSNSTLTNYLSDVQVQYSAKGFEIEIYNIQNSTINHTSFPTAISLFDLNSTDAQTFKIIYKDSSFLPVKDAIIEIKRKYIDSGDYEITERPITDTSGSTIAHLVVGEVIYVINVIKYEVLLASFSDSLAKCQNPTITDCVINLNEPITSTPATDFRSIGDFNFTLSYNESSRIIESIYEIPSGSSSVIILNVTKEDSFGTSVCTDTLTSSKGTLSCTVGNSFGNATVRAQIYKDGVLQSFGQVKIGESASDIYGSVQIILALFLFMTILGMAMSDNPIATVLLIFVGVLLLYSINIVDSTGYFGKGATILFLAIAIILIIYKGGKRN